MFVQSVKFLQAHGGNRDKISVYGQESNADTWKMAKMNMAIRGIDANMGNPLYNFPNWTIQFKEEDKRQ